MKRSFSFSEKPVLFLLHRFPSILPGIEKVVSIYYDQEYDKLSSYSIRKERENYLLEETRVEDPDGKLQKFRNDSSPYLWMQSDDIPFELKTKEKVQLSIFNELNNNILLLRIYNDIDCCHDLFFIYFNQSPSNFGIVDSKKAISTENKSIIGHLLRNVVITYLANSKEDRELFISLSESNQSVINELNHSRKELAIIKEKNKEGITHLCKSHLVDLSRECGYNFMFSEEAIKKLRDYEGELGLLKFILEKAVQYAISMQISNNINDILIHDYHLIFNVNQSRRITEVLPATEQANDIPARYNRTFLFLNKLENAAQSVKSKNLLLTSLNVGNAFPSPITPSAISDALKNHQSKIIYLFRELPNRWQIIRSEFRPVQNILNPKQERQKRTG